MKLLLYRFEYRGRWWQKCYFGWTILLISSDFFWCCLFKDHLRIRGVVTPCSRFDLCFKACHFVMNCSPLPLCRVCSCCLFLASGTLYLIMLLLLRCSCSCSFASVVMETRVVLKWVKVCVSSVCVCLCVRWRASKRNVDRSVALHIKVVQHLSLYLYLDE